METNEKSKKIEETLAQLTGLYQKDPEKFEVIRKELIEQTIESFPVKHQQRARGMQFVLEMRLRKYKDPVVRMNKMVEIFWEQFGLFQDVLKNPNKVLVERQQQKGSGPQDPGLVIPFKKKETALAQGAV